MFRDRPALDAPRSAERPGATGGGDDGHGPVGVERHLVAGAAEVELGEASGAPRSSSVHSPASWDRRRSWKGVLGTGPSGVGTRRPTAGAAITSAPRRPGRPPTPTAAC